MGHILEWNDQYKTGVRAIDADHRRLFALINKAIFDLRRGRFNGEHWSKELNSYAAEHFMREELLMERYLPDWEQRSAHIREHRQYWQKLTHLEQMADIDEREAFLRSWWTSHVMIWDKSLGQKLQQVQDQNGLPRVGA